MKFVVILLTWITMCGICNVFVLKRCFTVMFCSMLPIRGKLPVLGHNWYLRVKFRHTNLLLSTQKNETRILIKLPTLFKEITNILRWNWQHFTVKLAMFYDKITYEFSFKYLGEQQLYNCIPFLSMQHPVWTSNSFIILLSLALKFAFFFIC